MGLLSKLFCKEEPTTASSVPSTPAIAAEAPDYVPFGPETRFITSTCAGCGIQKQLPNRWQLGDWRVYSIKLRPDGKKYDNLVACADCRPKFDAAVKERDDQYNRAILPWREAHAEAQQFQNDWSRVNPRPTVPRYDTREQWIRRITCGCCGQQHDEAFDISKMPATASWPWLAGKKYGVRVCPACLDLPQHIAVREALTAHDEKRDKEVGRFFREADKLRPEWTVPSLPAGVRFTARIKRVFGL